MEFELPAELAASVRRPARDTVEPRARAIDATGEYPDDPFETFRPAGRLGRRWGD
jgi:hypothetical protein